MPVLEQIDELIHPTRATWAARTNRGEDDLPFGLPEASATPVWRVAVLTAAVVAVAAVAAIL